MDSAYVVDLPVSKRPQGVRRAYFHNNQSYHQSQISDSRLDQLLDSISDYSETETSILEDEFDGYDHRQDFDNWKHDRNLSTFKEHQGPNNTSWIRRWYNSPSKRPYLFLLLSFIVLLCAFVMNAILIVVSVVGIDRDPLDFDIKLIHLSNLCNDEVILQAEAVILNPTLASFSLNSGIMKIRSDGNDMLVVPLNQTLTFKSGQSTLVKFKSKVNFSDDAVKYAVEMLRYKKFESIDFQLFSQFNVETSAFWIPIKFNLPTSIPLRSNPKEGLKKGGFGIREISFLNDIPETEGTSIEVTISNYGNHIKPYFMIEIPDMQLNIVRKMPNNTHAILGNIEVQKHEYSTNQTFGSPIKANIVFKKDEHLANWQNMVSDTLNQQIYTVEFKEASRCRLARWVDGFGFTREINATQIVRSELMHSTFRSILNESNSFQATFDVDVHKATISEMINQPGQLIKVNGKVPKLALDVNLYNSQDRSISYPDLVTLEFEYENDAPEDRKTSLFPFSLRLILKSFGRISIILDPTWDTLHVGGSQDSFISSIIDYHLKIPRKDESNFTRILVPDLMFDPLSGNSESINYFLGINVTTDSSKANIKAEIIPPEKQSVSGLIFRFSWPEIKMAVGLEDYPLMSIQTLASNISYTMGKNNVLALIFGSPINLEYNFNDAWSVPNTSHEPDQEDENQYLTLLSIFLRDFFQGKPLRNLTSYFEVNGISSVFKGTWAGFEPSKIQTVPVETGFKSPFSKVFAFQGMELMGFNSTTLDIALSLVNQINIASVSKGQIIQNERSFGRPIKVDLEINLPDISLAIKRADDGLQSELLKLTSPKSQFLASSFIGKEWESYSKLQIESHADWDGFQTASLPNSAIIRCQILDSKAVIETLNSLMFFYETNKGSSLNTTSNVAQEVIKMYPQTDGKTFSELSLVSRLFAFLVDNSKGNDPMIYFVAGSKNFDPMAEGLPQDLKDLAALQVLDSERAKFEATVSSDSFQEIYVDFNLLLPNTIFDGNKSNSQISVKDTYEDSGQLAEKFLIQWGNLEFNFATENVDVASLIVDRGRIAVNLGTNKNFAIAFDEFASTLSKAFHVQAKVFGDRKKGYTRDTVKFLQAMLDESPSLIKISGKVDLYGNEGDILPIELGSFDFQDIVGILKSKREGARKRDSDAKPLLPDRMSDYVSVFIDSARNESQLIPCLIMVGCMEEETREPSFDLIASVQIDLVKETLSRLVSEGFIKIMKILGIRQRPKFLQTNIILSSLNLSPVINGVPLLSISSDPLNIELLTEINMSLESGVEIKLDRNSIDPIIRESIKIELIPDSVPKIGVLLKDLPIVDFFVNQNRFQKAEKNVYLSMMSGNLLSQSLSIAMGEQLISSSNFSTNSSAKSSFIYGTSHDVLSLDFPLAWVPSAYVPAIYLNSISIEIFYKGFKIIEVSFPRLQGVLALADSKIRINGFKSTEDPKQQQAFNDFLYLIALRQTKFHVDVKISKILRNMRRVTIFDHKMQFPPVTKAADFVKSIKPGFQSSFGWSPKVDIMFNNLLDWEMYVTKLEIDLFHWSDLQKWRDLNSLNNPDLVTGSKRYAPKCEQESEIEYWRRQCSIDDRATTEPLLHLQPAEQGQITLPLKWGGTFLALKDALGKCMSINGSIAVGFRNSNEGSFVTDLRLVIPYQGIGSQCLQFERTRCYPMLDVPEKGLQLKRPNPGQSMFNARISPLQGFRISFMAIHTRTAGNSMGKACLSLDKYLKTCLSMGKQSQSVNVTFWYFPVTRHVVGMMIDENLQVLHQIQELSSAVSWFNPNDLTALVTLRLELEYLVPIDETKVKADFVIPRKDASRVLLDPRSPSILRLELNDTCNQPYISALRYSFSLESETSLSQDAIKTSVFWDSKDQLLTMLVKSDLGSGRHVLNMRMGETSFPVGQIYNPQPSDNFIKWPSQPSLDSPKQMPPLVRRK